MQINRDAATNCVAVTNIFTSGSAQRLPVTDRENWDVFFTVFKKSDWSVNMVLIILFNALYFSLIYEKYSGPLGLCPGGGGAVQVDNEKFSFGGEGGWGGGGGGGRASEV